MVDIAHILRESRIRAASQHFPPFVGPEQESTPLNATPYIAHLSEAGTEGFLSNREGFIEQLRVGLARLAALSARPVAALLGGSALDAKPDPSDLDCVVFYEADEAHPPSGSALLDLQRALKRRRLDIRFVPIDGDPLLLIKIVSYFTILYSKSRESLSIKRGLVLLDCREPGIGNDHDKSDLSLYRD